MTPGVERLSQSISDHSLWLSQPSIFLNLAATKQFDSPPPQMTYLTGVASFAPATPLSLSEHPASIVRMNNDSSCALNFFLSGGNVEDLRQIRAADCLRKDVAA